MSGKQTLLVFKGHPATGKSTLANALARRLQWPLIDKDDIKDFTYTLADGGRLSYDIMWRIVRHQLQIGLNVLVDSTLSYPSLYAIANELANSVTARLLVVETELPPALWQARLEQRSQEPQTHRTTGWAAMQQLLTHYDGSWQYSFAPHHHLCVDTSRPLAELVQQVIEHLENLKMIEDSKDIETL